MRRRSSTTLPRDVALDLAALDAALAGDPVAADRAELGALALLLRDDRPAPEPGFAAALDERAAAGFPAVPAPRRPADRRRRARVGLGVLASGAAAAVIAVALVGGDTGPAVPDGPVAATTTAAPEAAGSSSAVAPRAGREAAKAPQAADATTTTTTAPLAQLAAPPAAADAATRSVERGASLRLATTPKRLDDVAAGVLRVTDAAGGYVLSSSVNAQSGAGGNAVFDLRIPAARLQSALAQLSQLAAVRARTQTSADVTAQVDATAKRIAGLRAARRSLLRQLAASPTADAAAALRARLRSVDRRLAQARAARADLRRRTTYSAVAVEVLTERRQSPVGGGAWTPGDALHDAGRVLAVALGIALVAGAVLLPLLVLAALAWPLVRSGRRRRREQALDGA